MPTESHSGAPLYIGGVKAAIDCTLYGGKVGKTSALQ